jgi:hypothetical protein
VIVWINGASGSGKTQVAYELRRRLVDAWVADPEYIGFALRGMNPRTRRDEFQRHGAWRRAVLDQLCEIDTEADRVILVPQALLEPEHVAEIVGGLRDDGHRVHHVSLIASPQTLARRLRTRGQGAAAGRIDK